MAESTSDTMADRIRRVLLPEVVSDQQRARLRQFLSIVAAIQVAGWSIGAYFEDDVQLRIAAAISIVHGVVCLVLARRGRLEFPRVTVPAVWLLAFLIAALGGYGLHDTTVMVMPLAVITAAFLMGRASAIVAALAAFIALSIIYICETTGVIETPLSHTLAPSNLVYVATILAAYLAMPWVMIGAMNQDVERARTGEAAARNAAEELDRQRIAVAESETRYRLLAENARDVVQVFGTDLKSHYVSPSIEKQRGFTVEEFMNMGPTELVPPETLEVLVRALSEELQAEQATELHPDRSRRFEVQVNTKNGPPIWVESIYTGIRNDKGEIVELLGVTRDIQDRKTAEAERIALQKQMQEMQRTESLGILAGGIAHDFNNLLSGILGNTDLALTKMADDAVGRAEMAKVLKIAEDAADLSRQLLAYSGKGKISVRTIDVSALLRDMTRVLNLTAGRHVELKLELAEEVSAVEVDVTQLRQVIMNLIINAADAMQGRPGAIHIRTGHKRLTPADIGLISAHADPEPGEYVFFEVADSGVGMTEEVKSRIFEPFFTTKPEGHGLGLAAALGIVRAHGGGVHVYSAPDIGTTVRVYLPQSAHAVDPIHESEPTDAAFRAHGTILVVDDEPTVSSMAQAVLELRGFTVMTATNGREAVDRFTEHRSEIRLILLDLTMPVMNGHEALEAIRAIDPHVPVILTSGFSEQQSARSSAHNGYTGFLQKPYKITELDGTVRAALGL